VLQEITELVVWGDQNSSRANSEVSSCANAVVDMFLETSVHMGRIPFKGEHRGKRILDDLHILLDLTDRKHSMLEGSREIKRQLLQTFNMLVQNINNDQVINLIIVHYMRDIIKYEFDWDDEDQVLACALATIVTLDTNACASGQPLHIVAAIPVTQTQ
jgi:hypothetical protein